MNGYLYQVSEKYEPSRKQESDEAEYITTKEATIFLDSGPEISWSCQHVNVPFQMLPANIQLGDRVQLFIERIPGKYKLKV